MFLSEQVGKLIIGIGVFLVIVGVLVLAAQKLPFLNWLGQLPGDIRHQSKDGKFTFYAPITTSILISLFLTVVINILIRLFRK